MSELDRFTRPGVTRPGVERGDEIEEARLQRLWHGVRVRAEAAHSGRRLFPPALGGALVAVAIAATFLVSTSPAPQLSGSTEGGARGGFLQLRGGGVPVASSVPEAAPSQTLHFEEGSRIQLAAGSRLVPTRNDEHEFHLELERGSLRVEVTPGLARRWRFVVGSMRVDVVGTAFELVRAPGLAQIWMDRGVVRVQAPGLREGGVLLRAGEQLTVPDEVAPASAAASARPTSGATAAVSSERPPAATSSPQASARSTHAEASPRRDRLPVGRAEVSRRREAARELGAPAPSAEALLALADRARDRGDSLGAVRLLERLLREHPRHAVTPVAAVTLGRIEMDVLHRPQSARRALGRALELGVPIALRRDVEQRIEQLDRSPD